MTPTDLAALQAVGRRGALAAADSLRLLLGTGTTVELTHADAAMLPDLVSRLGGSASGATAIAFRVTGEIPGSMLLVLPGDGAARMATAMLGVPVGLDLGNGAQSAVEEAGNILASRYLTEVGRAAQIELLPSVPHLIRGRLDSLLDLSIEIVGVPPQAVLGIDAGLAARPAGPTMFLAHFLAVDATDAVPRLLRAAG